MNSVRIHKDLKKYITQTYIQDNADCMVLRFYNGYSVIIAKKPQNEHAVVTLFFGIQKLGNLLYFKNNEDLNVFLRETLERK